MPIYTLMNPGGAPGVTTLSLATTYAWQGRVLLAECDPKGGNVLNGFMGGRMQSLRGGLLALALALAHNDNPNVLWEHVISLDQKVREWLLLPGIRDPRQMAQLAGAWDAIVEVLATAAKDVADVVVDIGNVGVPNAPMRLVAASDLAVMVLRPTLRQVSDAKPRLDAIGRYVGNAVPVALCLNGRGRFTAEEISPVLFDLPVIATIPHDPRSAALLSDGERPARSLHFSALMRGAARLGAAMRAYRHDDYGEEAGNGQLATEG